MSRKAINFPILALWLAVQVLTLAAAAFHYPLSIRPIHPPESLALYEIVAVQIIVGTLLFPLLMRDRATAAVVILAAWPMICLAGLLAAAPAERLATAAGYVSLWLAALALMNQILHQKKYQLIFVALAALLALGGVALWYFRAEFSPGMKWSHPQLLGPLMGAMAVIDGPSPLAWLVPAGAFAAALLAFLIARLRVRNALRPD